MVGSVLTVALFLCHSLQLVSAFNARGLFGVEQQGLFRTSSKTQLDRQIHSQSWLHSSDISHTSDFEGEVKNVQKYDYQIKKAKKKDIKEISRLCVDTFLCDGDDWLHINQEKQRVARDLGHRWSAANTTYLIVEAVPKAVVPSLVLGDLATEPPIAGGLVGFVEVALTREHCFVLAADAPYREFRPKVTSLVVDSLYRRQGIASLLLSACVAQSKLWSGHSELFLEVRNENRDAILCYKKMGFRECTGAKDLVDSSSAHIGLYILHNKSDD